MSEQQTTTRTTCPICGSQDMRLNWAGYARFCLDCDRDIPDHIVQASALHKAMGTIAAKVRRDSTVNYSEPTSVEISFEEGEWIVDVTWWHHDGPIEECEGRSTESYEAAIIALAAKIDSQEATLRAYAAKLRQASE